VGLQADSRSGHAAEVKHNRAGRSTACWRMRPKDTRHRHPWSAPQTHPLESPHLGRNHLKGVTASYLMTALLLLPGNR
jgi:hypothetical protein